MGRFFLAISLTRRLWAMADCEDDAAFNGRPLPRYLRPASIWIIITDTYFPKDGAAARALARAMTAAQAGLRWLIVVDHRNHRRSIPTR